MALRKDGPPGESASTATPGPLPAPTSCCPRCSPPQRPAHAAAGAGDGVRQLLCRLPSRWGCCLGWWPLPLRRDWAELHRHFPPCMHQHVFPVPSHWPSLSLWDLDLWGLYITIEFDSNKLKVSNGCMEVTTHLKSIVRALGSLISKEEERGTSGFPPYVSASFLAHVPEPLDLVTIFQMAAIRWSDYQM